jgi:putative FmdB family regulatory protein
VAGGGGNILEKGIRHSYNKNMPTYEYQCKSCSHQFDVFQSMKDAPLKTCPQCGGEVRRVINGGGGVIFKGNGFYVTDKKNAAKSGGEKSPGGKDAGQAAPCAACPAAASGACPSAAA